MIELYTSATPNGYKISIALEEMGIDYQVKPIDLSNNEQKSDEFLAINPNGRIPVIVDKGNGNFPVFESGAILIYLAELSRQFLPTDQKSRSEVIQWLMFQMGGIGPMQGQSNVFFRYFPEKIQPAIDRYQNETKRLYTVLDGQLNGNKFLCNDLSIADFATWPWVRAAEWAGVDTSNLKNLSKWLDRCSEREGFQRGIEVPYKREKLTEAQLKKFKEGARKILQT